MDRSHLAPNETFWPLDCSNYDQVLAACQGVDVVLHLAADPSGGAEIESLLPRNIIAAYNVFNAAAAGEELTRNTCRCWWLMFDFNILLAIHCAF